MAKNEWKIKLTNNATERHVANDYQSIFIDNPTVDTPTEVLRRNRTIAYIIKDALNAKNPYPYEKE